MILTFKIEVLKNITEVTAILTYLVREIGSNLVTQEDILWFLGGELAYLNCKLASHGRRRKEGRKAVAQKWLHCQLR